MPDSCLCLMENMSKQSLQPFVPTKPDKIGGLPHVAYEIGQILALISTWPREQGLQMNAWLEAFLIHVRLLMDFFEHSNRSSKKGRENDDILAIDYDFPSQPIQINSMFRERLNKDLAHLSYSRQERIGDSKKWNLRDILPLLDRCHEFSNHVCSHWASDVTAEEVARWKILVQNINKICMLLRSG